jgi:hypothetical protein
MFEQAKMPGILWGGSGVESAMVQGQSRSNVVSSLQS